MTATTKHLLQMDAAYAEARRIYSEKFYFQLEKKTGGRDALLSLTSEKPRGQVEFIISTFFDELAPEDSAAAVMLSCSHRFLFDQEAMLDALEAAPWGEDA